MSCTRNAQKILVGKPEGKIPLGRSGRRCEDNIKRILKQYDELWNGFIWLGIETSGVNTIMNV
jgi:hypothetical protein